MKPEILNERALLYGDLIYVNGAPLKNCIGIIYCTKIFMCRPGGQNVNQRSFYSGHKRDHCIIYLIITTNDGLVSVVYVSQVGLRH